MTMDVTLPSDLERCAVEAVQAGRFRDRAELVAAGVALLRERDAARAELMAANEEADRVGCSSRDEVAARVRDRIARRTNAAA
jgi:Arc/MetJ-type ribon-helix-helix transcriptional regulator